MQPAVANGRLGGLGIAVVAVHHDVGSDDDLADLLAVRPDVAAVVMDDADLDARQSPARPGLALDPHLGWLGFGEERAGLSQCQDRRGLRQPVTDDGLDPERLLEAANQRGGRGRAADDQLLEAREVVLGSVGVVQDGVEDRGHGQDPGDAMLLDRGHEGGRLEPAEHHVPAADHRQEMRRSPAVDVEQRNDVEDDVVLREAEPNLRIEGMQMQLPMRHRDTFGKARGAARVEQLGHRVLVDVRMERLRGAAGEHGLVLVGRDSAGLAFHDHEAGQVLELRGDLFDERFEVAVEEHDPGSGVADDVGDLAGVRRMLIGFRTAPASRTPK